MIECRACGKQVDNSKPEGFTGYHRYSCIGPSTWSGLLQGYFHPETCWCGGQAKFRITRGLSNLYACSTQHARKRAVSRTARISGFAPFVQACYSKS